MACTLCHRDRADYALVDGDEPQAAVCEECVEEYLTPEPSDPTCIYCDAIGDYDLVQLESTLRGAVESEMEYSLVEKDVICDEHFEDLVEEGG